MPERWPPSIHPPTGEVLDRFLLELFRLIAGNYLCGKDIHTRISFYKI